MRTIELSQDQITIVDNVDFEWLSIHKWHATKRETRYKKYFYAVRTGARNTKGKQRHFAMHREIMGLTYGDGIEIDHINGNTLDNRRENLRIATHAENMRNSDRLRNNKVGYKGVHKTKEKFQALISLGTFDTAKEAARAYDKWATRIFGEFARLNFPEEDKI